MECDDAPMLTPASKSAPRFDLLLAHTDSVFCVVERSPVAGKLLLVSDSARRVLGAHPDDLVSRHFLDLFPEDRGAAAALLAAAVTSNADAPPAVAHLRAPATTAYESDVGKTEKKGCRQFLEAKLSSDGEFLYCALRDVTEEKIVEETLRCFMLSTSHDLRTPIHGMQIASTLLTELPNVAKQQDTQNLISIVRAVCHIMLVTIDNVLALKMLEEATSDSQTCANAPEGFDVRAMFADVLDVVRVGSCVDVTWRNDDDDMAPIRLASLVGPASRVRQVLTSAALCVARGVFVPSGPDALTQGRGVASVEASLALCEAGAGMTRLRASFAANGVMLSADEAAACFDPYASCGGLALHVSRALACALGGDLHVATAPGKTTIHISLCLPCNAGSSSLLHRAFMPAMPVAPPLAAHAPAHLRRKSGTVLSVRQLTERMFGHLTQHGDELFSSGVVLPDGAGAIYDYFSPSVTRWLGWTQDDMLGNNAADFTHPHDVTLLGSVLGGVVARSCANGNAPTPIETPMLRRMRHKDGSWVYVKSAGALVGARWHCVCRSLRGQAAREAAVRSLLLAVSREIRTPAQSGQAAAALLAQHPCVRADPEAQFLVSAILSSCSLLLNMASNAISLRCIEAGTLQMQPAFFEPAEAIDELLRVCNLGTSGREARDGGSAPAAAALAPGGPPLPSRVRGDRALFCHALQNLLTNGIKYDDGTGVRVSVACKPVVAAPTCDPMEQAAAAIAPTTPPQATPGGNGSGEWEPTHTLLVTVTDGGRGVSAEQCGRIFNCYECAPSSQGGGHGLGLYIARACARRSGGDVSVRSTPGHGCSFTLAFPVELAPEEEAPLRETPPAPESLPKRARSPEGTAPVPEPVPAPPAKRASGAIAPLADDEGAPVLRVCLADDNRLNLRLLSRLLATAGFGHVTACDDGAEALAALTGGATFHLAVLDMCMPMPGPAVARALRAWEAEHGAPHLPVYCLTANVLAEHRAECEDAGFDGFLTKPLRQENLAELRTRARAYAAAA